MIPYVSPCETAPRKTQALPDMRRTAAAGQTQASPDMPRKSESELVRFVFLVYQ